MSHPSAGPGGCPAGQSCTGAAFPGHPAHPVAVRPVRNLVRPFTADDPLCFPELPPDQLALRALLAVLADTGATVEFPAHLYPGYVPVEVASGWTLRADAMSDADAGVVRLRVDRVPPDQIPGCRQ